MEGLDDIAGGNLYRLRRNEKQGDRVVERASRSRGGKASNVPAPTQQLFNDGRKGRSQPNLVQAALSELRQVSTEAATSRGNRSRRRRNQQQQAIPAHPVPAPPPASTRARRGAVPRRDMYASQSVPARLHNSYATGVLTSQSEFTARMNIKSGPVEARIYAPAPAPTSALASEISDNSSAFLERLAASSFKISSNSSAAEISRVVSTQPVPITPANIVKQTPFRGLAASRFATSAMRQENTQTIVESNHIQVATIFKPQVHVQNPPIENLFAESYDLSSPQKVASPATKPVRTEIGSTQDKHSVLKSQGNIKISLDGAQPKFGNVSLLKNNDNLSIILQVEVQDRIVLHEALTEADIFACSASTITYKAISQNTMSPVWKFTFRLPNEAFAIWKAWNMAVAHADRGLLSTTALLDSLSQGTAMHDVPQQSRALPALPDYPKTTTTKSLHQLPADPASKTRGVRSILSESLPAIQTTLISQQESQDTVQISSPAAALDRNLVLVSNETVEAQDVVEDALIDFEDSGEIDKVEKLNLHGIDYLAGELEVPNIPGVMDLVVNEPQAKWILTLLDARPEGSFLQQVMKLAKFELGVEPTPKLVKAAEWVVKGYFMFSETFHQLPDELMDAYVEEAAKKVLLEAISVEAVVESPVVDGKVHRTGLSQSLADFHFAGTMEHEPEREDFKREKRLEEVKKLKEERMLAEEQLKKRGGLAASRFAPSIEDSKFSIVKV